jgi:putative ABC transport system ATP-binding protein
MPILIANQLHKSYRNGPLTVDVLKDVSFRLEAGESVAVMGTSGSGKTTLLQILGAMLVPDRGTVEFAGHDLLKLDDSELSKLRRRELGFVFQKFNLLHTMTAEENIAWPLVVDGRPKQESLLRARELLKRMGLDQRAAHFPSQLSGGEQQRVAIARAVVAKPRIVFADEPTGALDSKTGQDILQILKESVLTDGGSLVMVTHDPVAARICDRSVHLKDGREC